MPNSPDSARVVLEGTGALLSRTSATERRLLEPRLLLLRGIAAYKRGLFRQAVDLLSEAHSAAARDLPTSDADAGRALAVMGMAENQLLQNEAGNKHRREAVEWLVRSVGTVDERTCQAHLTYSWIQVEPRESHAVLDELEQARSSMLASGYGGSIGVSWLEEGLAQAHAALGHWDRARALYLHALEGRTRWCSGWHQEVAALHLSIASVFRRYDSPFALEHAYRARAICDSLGYLSESRSLQLHYVLGTIYANQSLWKEARGALEPTVTGYVRLHGPRHWETAAAAVQLARIEWILGDIRAADSLFAMSTRAADFADIEATASIATNVVRRARFLLAQGQMDSLASVAMPHARAIADELDGVLPWLLDDEGERVAVYLRGLVDALLSGLLDTRSLPPNYASSAFELAVRSRSVVLESRLAHLGDMARDERDSSGTGGLRASLRRELAEVALASFRQQGGANTRAKRDSLREALRSLESSMLEERPPLDSALRFTELRDHVTPGSAVISYFRFADLRNLNPAVLRPRELPPRLVAFVTDATSPSPRWFDLGPVATVDSLALLYLRSVERDDGARAREAGRSLRERLWGNLSPALRGIQRAYVVTEGVLDLIPFHALPDSNGNFLLEEDLVLHRLVHERDMLLPGTPTHDRHEALLVGDVNYDTSRSSYVAASSGLRSVPECAMPLDAPFGRLPASRSEIEALRRILQEAPSWRVTTWSGGEASEGALKRLSRGPAVLHLATHGFFIDSTCSTSAGDAELLSSNPLVFSGLALAGANRARSAAAMGEEDGLLTAEELAGLDLRGTEWLVLSGCRSGAGQATLRLGDGLYGLPRAARAAGARTTLISLWPVADEATAYWMAELYRAHFQRGEDTALAVRSASRATLRRLRSLGTSLSPRLWGAFVAIGDWR